MSYWTVLSREHSQILKKAQDWFDLAGEVEDHRYTLECCVADYVAHLKVEKGETSAKGVKQRLEKHLVPKLGKMELAKLTTPQLKWWGDSKVRISDDSEDVRKSKDSVNRLLSQAKAAFNLAFRNGLVATDRAWRRVPAFEGVGEARKSFLTDEQVTRLLKQTDGAFRQLVKLAVLTGACYGELIQARVRDLDQTNGTLHLTGKTGKRDCYLSDEALAFF